MNEYEKAIAKNAHPLIGKNVSELMEGMGAWDSKDAILAIEKSVEKGILRQQKQIGPYFQHIYFVRVANEW